MPGFALAVFGFALQMLGETLGWDVSKRRSWFCSYPAAGLALIDVCSIINRSDSLYKWPEILSGDTQVGFYFFSWV